MTATTRTWVTMLSAVGLFGCAQPSGGNPVAPMPPAQGAAGDLTRQNDQYSRAARSSPYDKWQYPVAPDINNSVAGMTTPPSKPSIDDGKILTIAQTSSLMDLELARAAADKARDPRVRALAASQAKEQQRVQARLAEVELESGVRPEQSIVADHVRMDAAARIDELSDKQGLDFDRTYLELTADSQRAALDRLDTQLVPSATDQDVAKLVHDLRPDVERDYERTRALMTKLGK